MNTKEITKLANSNGWILTSHQRNNYLLIFRRGEEQINIWYTRMTVATVVNHPKQGRQQLYRKDVTDKELEKLLNNPRTHTNKGYRFNLLKFFTPKII